jgi:hypothetical protein
VPDRPADSFADAGRILASGSGNISASLAPRYIFQPGQAAPRSEPMNRFAIILLLMASPAWAQNKPVAGKRADPCAPIGQTGDGKLVYSMLCKNLPLPPAPTADTAAAPAEPAEEDKGGLFKFPLPGLIKPTYDQKPNGAAVQVR